MLLSQTTLSVDETADVIAALQQRFPWIELPPTPICYATSNRQEAVKPRGAAGGLHGHRRFGELVELGAGSWRSRTRRSARAREAHRVDDAAEMDPAWFAGVSTVVASPQACLGADESVAGVVERLQELRVH